MGRKGIRIVGLAYFHHLNHQHLAHSKNTKLECGVIGLTWVDRVPDVREYLVQGNRSLDVKVVLPVWTQWLLVDDRRPLRRFIGYIAVNQGRFYLARLRPESAFDHLIRSMGNDPMDLRQDSFQDGKPYQPQQTSPPLCPQLQT